MGRWKIIKYISFDFSKPTSKTNDLKELFPNRIAAGASIQVPSIPKDQTSNGFLHREEIILHSEGSLYSFFNSSATQVKQNYSLSFATSLFQHDEKLLKKFHIINITYQLHPHIHTLICDA